MEDSRKVRKNGFVVVKIIFYLLYKNNKFFLRGYKYSDKKELQKLIDKLFDTNWVVYLKESFERSSLVLEYLARNTHRIAIINYQILKVENNMVSFLYKDYKENTFDWSYGIYR